MNYNTTEPLEQIEELMMNGNWQEAKEEFKALNCTTSDFRDWIEERSSETLEDFTLLGFYCCEYVPKEGEEYDCERF